MCFTTLTLPLFRNVESVGCTPANTDKFCKCCIVLQPCTASAGFNDTLRSLLPASQGKFVETYFLITATLEMESSAKNSRYCCFHYFLLSAGLVVFSFLINQRCGGFNFTRLVTKAMGDRHEPVVFRKLCPPRSTARKSAAKIFYHLLGKYLN